MQDSNSTLLPNRKAEVLQIALTILPQENGRFACAFSASSVGVGGSESVFYGQTQEHALAIALEHLADFYRTAAEAKQQRLEPDVKESDASQSELKRYHVILHYERTIEEESRFEAMHNTLLGNTVVENAKCALIEIAPDARQKVICRDWSFDNE